MDQIQCSVLLLVHVLYPPPLLCTVDVNEQEMILMALKQIKILMQPFHRWDWIVCYLVTFVVCLWLFKKSYNHILLWHCYQNTWTHKVHFQFHKNHQSRHTTETDERSTFHSCLLRNALMVFLFCLFQTFYKCFLILGKKSFPTSESQNNWFRTIRQTRTTLWHLTFTWNVTLSH